MTEEHQTDRDDLLNYEQMAKKIGLSKATLQRRVREGKIPFIRMGHQVVRFHYPTVLKYLNQTN